MQFSWKAGGGASTLLTHYAGSYLPFLIANSFTAEKHQTLLQLLCTCAEKWAKEQELYLVVT